MAKEKVTDKRNETKGPEDIFPMDDLPSCTVFKAVATEEDQPERNKEPSKIISKSHHAFMDVLDDSKSALEKLNDLSANEIRATIVQALGTKTGKSLTCTYSEITTSTDTVVIEVVLKDPEEMTNDPFADEIPF